MGEDYVQSVFADVTLTFVGKLVNPQAISTNLLLHPSL
jgi:hypothetical protein